MTKYATLLQELTREQKHFQKLKRLYFSVDPDGNDKVMLEALKKRQAELKKKEREIRENLACCKDNKKASSQIQCADPAERSLPGV